MRNSPHRKVKLEKVGNTQPPFTHMEYFSPLLMLKDKSVSLFRDITASLSEEEDAKRGERMECGGKD